MKRNNLNRKPLSGLFLVLTAMVLVCVCAIGAYAAAAAEYTENTNVIQNEYLVATANGGRLALYTTGGNPESADDNGKNLLFGALNEGTSDAVCCVDGYVGRLFFDNTKATPEGDSLYSVCEKNGVKYERYISFVYNTYTLRYDTIEYKYVITNTSESTKAAGIRMFFDTMLGDNDHAPFRIAGENVTTFREFTGDDIPQVWTVVDNLDAPTVVANGRFYSDISDRPDMVQFIRYGDACRDDLWYTSSSGSIGDSSVNVYFNAIDLAPGASRTVKTYYGLSEVDVLPPEPTTEISFAATAPRELQTNGDMTAYLGNPFTFDGWVRNIGDADVTNVRAELSLPDGLTATYYSIDVGTVSTRTEIPIYWEITAADRSDSAVLEYSVTVSGEGIEPQTYYYSIYVPELIHEHAFELVEVVDATCTEYGEIRYICNCEEMMVEYTPPLGHNYISEITVPATCTSNGVIKHTCTRCFDIYYTYVSQEHLIYLEEYVQETCEQDGYKKYACEYCDYENIEVIPGGHLYVAQIIKVATQHQEGEILYTCSRCGDSYTVIVPVRPYATLLLVQDNLPWTEDINAAVLDRLVDGGYLSGWDLTTTANFASVDLSEYNVIYIANDQTTATYDQLGRFNEIISSFANAGGVVVYGACDNGWAAGEISYTLPGGVSKRNYYSYHNYIVNYTHGVVTGIYTDGKALTNELLYSTYSSHTYFENLPDGAVAILEDANGKPTLVEYPVGNGYVIASGLTWEYTYVRDFVNGTSFAKSVYDDLLVYALMIGDMCDHNLLLESEVLPTCTEDGYKECVCTVCGGNFRIPGEPATGHTPGEWIVTIPVTATQNGEEVRYCLVCGELVERRIIGCPDAPTAYVEAENGVMILGQDMVFTVYVNNCDEIKSMAIVPVFDETVFELVSAEWSIPAILQYVEPGSNRAVSAWDAPTDVNGAVFSFVLRAKKCSPSTLVTAELMIQETNEVEALSVVGSEISVVECSHDVCFAIEVDEEYHIVICEACERIIGFELHVYDDESDMKCNECDHIRVLRGDVNGDGSVDTDDAIHLLLHIFYPEDYEINQLGDIDGDGSVASDDAIWLLLHVFYPEDYQLFYPVGGYVNN